MIRCNCLKGHEEHQFLAGEFSLCKRCGHTVGAHQPNQADVPFALIQTIRRHKLVAWDIDTYPEIGQLCLTAVLEVTR